METDAKSAAEPTGDVSPSPEDHDHTPWDEGRNDTESIIPISQPPEAGVGDDLDKPASIPRDPSSLPEPISDNQVGIAMFQAEHARNVEDENDRADGAASLPSVTADEIEREPADRDRTSETKVKEYQARSDEYARVTGLFVEGLQARVAMLEEGMHEIRTSKGSGKGPGGIIPKLLNNAEPPDNNVPCAEGPPLKIKRLNVKDLKARYAALRKEACVLLGFAASSTFIEVEPIRSSAQLSSATRPRLAVGEGPEAGGPQNDGSRPKATDVERFTCSSPWLSILIELLSDVVVYPFDVWLYPFKHLIGYEEQVRQFVKLLGELNLNSLKAKDMLPTLRTIIEQVKSSLGSKRRVFEHSNASIEKILRKKSSYFPKHFQKIESIPSHADHGSGAIQEMGSGASTDQSNMPKSGGAKPIDLNSTEDRNKPTQLGGLQHLEATCTCLRDARDHLKLVVDVLDEDLASLIALRRAISDCSLAKIRFKDLWNLYQPGDLVVTSKQPYQAYRVIFVGGGRHLLTKFNVLNGNESVPFQYDDLRNKPSLFRIECVRLDFDGNIYGPVQVAIQIDEYNEEKKITELEVYPIGFSDDETELRESLTKRGHHFATYQEFKHKRYAGFNLLEPSEEIESEVMIDFEHAFRNPGYAHRKPKIGIESPKWPDIRELYEDRCVDGQCLQEHHNWILDDVVFDEVRRDHYINIESKQILQETQHSSQAWTPDQLILLPFRVPAFSLRTRRWVALNIECVEEVQQHDSPDGKDPGFEDLVIPEEYKRIVKSLVKSHALGLLNSKSQQVDLIRGKGKGLVILLHGVPGVGKTSTAESVAAFAGNPLFPITSADIGQSVQDVDQNLRSIFYLARRWGCVLLIDEADVFLEKRDRGGNSIERNALVTVFLRTLEYYTGILFLTTNRVGAFDEAFVSRIHVSLYYGNLDQENTYKIWMMHINRLKRSNRNIFIAEDELKTFAREHWSDDSRLRWNGRQIRNAFHTALALAEYEFHENCLMCEETGDRKPLKPALRAQHFKVVAKTSAEFADYLTSVLGGSSHKDKARVAEMRSDEWQDEGIETPTGKRYSTQRVSRLKLPLGPGQGV